MNPAKQYTDELHHVLRQLPFNEINSLIDHLHRARVAGSKTFIMGNGGSASTASHFVCDLGKNTIAKGWPNFRVIGLSDNMALMTAYANDDGYETVFSRQMEGMVAPDDLVIAISTSGNSPNVVGAVQHANRAGAMTIGLTGFDGGQLGRIVDLHIHVPSDTIEQVEDVHLIVEHLVCKALRERALSASFPKQESARASADPRTRMSGPAMVHDVMQAVRDRSDLGDLLQKTLDLAVQKVGAASGSILVLDPQGEIIEGAISYAGEIKRHSIHRLAEFLRSGLAGWVAQRGEAALIRDTSSDPRWRKSSWELAGQTSRSAACVPIFNERRLVGVLTLVSRPPDQFTETDLALLMAIAVAVSMGEADVFDIGESEAAGVPSSLLLPDEGIEVDRATRLNRPGEEWRS